MSEIPLGGVISSRILVKCCAVASDSAFFVFLIICGVCVCVGFVQLHGAGCENIWPVCFEGDAERASDVEEHFTSFLPLMRSASRFLSLESGVRRELNQPLTIYKLVVILGVT